MSDPLTISSSTPLQWRILTESEWRTLREVRLTALKDSPKSFLSNYTNEIAYDEARWREEFSRGEWIVAATDESINGLIGITHGDDIGPDERYLEYLWISPAQRRTGIAARLIHTVLERLSSAGIASVWLWILDGNEPARELYNKCGFISTGERQPLKADPYRCEERMLFRLKLSTG